MTPGAAAIADDLAAGRLEPGLPDELFFAGRLLAVYPTRKYIAAKVHSLFGLVARDPQLK